MPSLQGNFPQRNNYDASNSELWGQLKARIQLLCLSSERKSRRYNYDWRAPRAIPKRVWKLRTFSKETVAIIDLTSNSSDRRWWEPPPNSIPAWAWGTKVRAITSLARAQWPQLSIFKADWRIGPPFDEADIWERDAYSWPEQAYLASRATYAVTAPSCACIKVILLEAMRITRIP